MKHLSKILMADDEPDILAICTMALETIGGYEVKTCSSGQGVLDCIDGFKPDLVVLDVMMPELDGPGTLTKLREGPAPDATPVIFLTAKHRQSDLDALRDLGALTSHKLSPSELRHNLDLALHDIKCHVHNLPSNWTNIGDTLLEIAHNEKAAFIVMGAFSQGKLRQKDVLSRFAAGMLPPVINREELPGGGRRLHR